MMTLFWGGLGALGFGGFFGFVFVGLGFLLVCFAGFGLGGVLGFLFKVIRWCFSKAWKSNGNILDWNAFFVSHSLLLHLNCGVDSISYVPHLYGVPWPYLNPWEVRFFFNLTSPPVFRLSQKRHHNNSSCILHLNIQETLCVQNYICFIF